MGLADSLEPVRDDFDRLIGDLRLATRFGAADYDRLEERAQMIAAAIVAPFRGGRDPSAPALSVHRDGRKFTALF